MIKSVAESDYRTIKGFCDHYKFALLLLSENLSVIEANKVTGRLFNVELDKLKGKPLIEFCHEMGIDCPISDDYIRYPKTQKTYHHALQLECNWNLIELKRAHYPSQWILLGKMLNQPLMTYHTNLSAQFLNHIPTPIYCKNHEGIYIKCNQATTDLANEDIIGKTDFDLPWYKQADFFKESDQHALKGDTITSRQTMQDHTGQTRQFRTTKSPIYGPDGEVVSLMIISLECPVTKEPDHIETIDIPIEGIHFDTQELEYIHWMIKGKTAEEMAMILKKSPRTIETHLTKIRRKTASQGQFQMGYMLAKYFTSAGICPN